jgi:predicted type IV restriction endonuclease
MKQALYRQETEEKKRRKTLEMDISKLNDATIDLEA